MPCFALGDTLVLSPPGVGRIAVREARGVGLDAILVSSDRRADVVGIPRPPTTARDLRTAEDVLVLAGTLPVRRTAAATAAALDHASVVEAVGLARAGADGRQRLGLRVVVRLSDERHFLRTALRTAVERGLGSLHDNSGTSLDELWVMQTDHRTLHVGVRVRALGRRSGRTVERVGALRPAVAAAMVVCTGRPRRVLDPCCGSGTILHEVDAMGGAAFGGDIDRGALLAASANTRAPIVRLDARRLPFRDDSFDAVVTNLPFGRRYQLQGSPVAWYRRTLGEALRVADSAVVLAPQTPAFRQALGRTKADLVERHEVRVLGQPAAIWSIRRR